MCKIQFVLNGVVYKMEMYSHIPDLIKIIIAYIQCTHLKC